MAALLKRLSQSRRKSSMMPGAYAAEILKTNTVLDVVKPQLEGKLVKAGESEDVLTVCARLADHKVSSLPVFSDDSEECIGIVDFSDAVAYLLKMDWDSLGSLKNGEGIWDELGSVPIATAIDLSERNPMFSINAGASLYEAISMFEEERLRRALVEDADGNIIAVLSPSAIVRYIMNQLKGRNDLVMAQTIAALKVGHGPVKSVKKTQTVLEAMHLMYRTRHSVVAVVDPTTKALAGSISMSDIKLVFEERRFSMLIGTCWNYIVEARERSDMEVFPFFGVNDTDQMQMVVSKLIATNVHHLYVVNKDQVPIKVISFTDVCATLKHHCA